MLFLNCRALKKHPSEHNRNPRFGQIWPNFDVGENSFTSVSWCLWVSESCFLMLPSPDCQHISQLSRTLMKIEDEDPDFPKKSENPIWKLSYLNFFLGKSFFGRFATFYFFCFGDLKKKSPRSLCCEGCFFKAIRIFQD